MIALLLFTLAEPHVVDLGAPPPTDPPGRDRVRFDQLDDHVQPPPAVPSPRRGTIAPGFTTADPIGLEDENKPGSEYPRKHTLYLNFAGADLMSGGDNSATNRSQLAENGPYPVFTGGEPKAIAAAQSLEADLAPFGVRVVYLERPPELLPYTMAMIGGEWMDTQLDSPAGGVAAAADCGATNQRRVVYVFADGGWSALEIASTAAQEAGHAWGLDHSYNCDSVMSYCAGAADKIFSDVCDDLCELDCQLPANCRETHEMFCGAGSDQQNEVEELAWLFGTDAPDMEAPTVEILQPEEGAMFAMGEPVDVVSMISDDYGGYAWKYHVERDGEVTYDQVNYTRDVDDMDRPYLQFVNLDPGEYTFTVIAMDHADQLGEASVHVTVMGDGADTTGGDEEDDGADETTGDGDDDDDDGDDDEGDDDTSGGTAAADDGGGEKGCAIGAAPRVVCLWPLVVAIAAYRRRR